MTSSNNIICFDIWTSISSRLLYSHMYNFTQIFKDCIALRSTVSSHMSPSEQIPPMYNQPTNKKVSLLWKELCGDHQRCSHLHQLDSEFRCSLKLLLVISDKLELNPFLVKYTRFPIDNLLEMSANNTLLIEF